MQASSGNEQVIVSAKASVMIYDDTTKKWNPSGSGPGVAKVHIYQNALTHTYRVAGRKLNDQEWVINCLLTKHIKYNQANQTFLQWRDPKQVYGLNFQSKDEADLFSQTMKLAIENLNRIAAAAAAASAASNGNTAPPPPPSSHPISELLRFHLSSFSLFLSIHSVHESFLTINRQHGPREQRCGVDEATGSRRLRVQPADLRRKRFEVSLKKQLSFSFINYSPANQLCH